MKYTIVVLLLAQSLFVDAQTGTDVIRTQAAADFKAVNDAYAKANKLKMSVGYTLFPSYTSTVPFDQQQGVFMKNGNNTYSYLLGIVSLSNSSVSVTLDSNEQAIVVADPSSNNDRSPSLADVDTLLKICSSIEYKELSEGIKYYKLRFDGVTFSEYNVIEVYIDSKTNFISRLMLFYRIEMDLDEEGPKCSIDKPRLEIVYTNVDMSPEFETDQFSETKMIRANGKAYTAAPAYSTYRVINNRIR